MSVMNDMCEEVDELRQRVADLEVKRDMLLVEHLRLQIVKLLKERDSANSLVFKMTKQLDASQAREQQLLDTLEESMRLVRLADDPKYDPRLVLTQIFTRCSEANVLLWAHDIYAPRAQKGMDHDGR